MPGSHEPPSRIPARVPQRVVVTGRPGTALTTFVRRAAEALDVPLVPLADLAGPDDVARLAAFEGWVTTGEYDAGLIALLERAEALLHLELAEPATLTGIVRRTLRRVRAETTPPPDRAWLGAADAVRPDLGVVRLSRLDEVEGWLRSVSA